MNRLQPYRQFLAIILLAALSLPLGLQEAHLFIDHHQPELQCETDANGLHLHTPEYGTHLCSICFFHLSHFIPGKTGGCAQISITPVSFEGFAPYTFVPAPIPFVRVPRGPPSLILT